MNSFQSVKRKLKNKMVKKSAIIIDDKPIEYAAYADDKGIAITTYSFLLYSYN